MENIGHSDLTTDQDSKVHNEVTVDVNLKKTHTHTQSKYGYQTGNMSQWPNLLSFLMGYNYRYVSYLVSYYPACARSTI